ncbi:MAG: hypothetical protein H7144_17285 [Burkholderiales bacterium]|nr:hypothetical protein [Phycisphaerae bacterium]
MNQSLADFFQKKKQQAGDSVGIDWNDRRDKYLKAVDDLYHQIVAILDEPIRQNTASLERRSKELSENYIGTYKADDMILLIGNEQVRFSPRGRNIVGASGRVDVIGERGKPEVLIVQPDGRWGFVQTRQPTLQVVPFDESTLTEVLKRVMKE